jgi:formylglycine-generating enzyme required for sulfatase activity
MGTRCYVQYGDGGVLTAFEMRKRATQWSLFWVMGNQRDPIEPFGALTDFGRASRCLQRKMARMTWFVPRLAITAITALLVACATPQTTNVSLTPSPTQNAAYALAEAGVTGNSEWTTYTEERNGALMALVPAGCFTMGSTDTEIDYAIRLTGSDMQRSRFSDQQPSHEVSFESPFWIDVHEVTQAQFAEFNGEAASASHFTGSNLPREQITWLEADAFCRARGARLPTEAEWEYAARGPDSLIFPWGDTFECSRGNFDDAQLDDPYVIEGFPNCDGYSGTAPVGSMSKGISWVGVLDLSGNVWEWVTDWYDENYYGTLREGAVDPLGPPDGDSHVLRGGAWSINEPDHLLAAFRGWYDPTIMGDFISIGKHVGFRCALSYNASRPPAH